VSRRLGLGVYEGQGWAMEVRNLRTGVFEGQNFIVNEGQNFTNRVFMRVRTS